MHISVPRSASMEYINETKISPLISKVQIKVCYVGQKPNRNGTVITKEVATKFGQNLPGTPIVGFFDKQTDDFDTHNIDVEYDEEKNEYKLIEITKPYGFVDVNAKVWFQVFVDDGVEHEYLMTEGYIWSGIYKESKRVPEKGNNQSMELNEEALKGFWSDDQNSGRRIFIISDGLIEKLCILGQEVEPCFEGAQIKSHFSFAEDPEFISFKETMFSMVNELKDIMSKGGSHTVMEQEKLNNGVENPTSENPNPASEFKKNEEEDENKKKSDGQEGGAEGDNGSGKDKKEEEDDKKKKGYDLEEVVEYKALEAEHNELKEKYAALEKENASLKEEMGQLKEFKLAADRKEKQAMIDGFYMLSEEDKADVVKNIDSYSLGDIEAKLSIICVRNRVTFSKSNDDGKEDKKVTFAVEIPPAGENKETNDDNAPDWVKCVRAKQ